MQEIIEIFMQNPVGQTFWIFWMITVVSAFLQRNDSNVVKILLIANIFWICHFYFMWIYTWLAISSLGFFRLVLSMKYKKNIKLYYVFLILIIWLGTLTYENPISLLPMVSSALSTYWFFFLEGVKLRLVLLLCSSFWFSFHYVHFSIWWMINESLIQFIHLFTIYKIIDSQWTIWSYVYRFKKLFKRQRFDYWRYLAAYDYVILDKKK